MAKHYGRTEPRLWTKPLRPLTPETSKGFAVIEFAAVILGIKLYPWQEWLLIHALELLEDGQYRFKRVIVLVARQQGKTTLASVLAAWWLYVDSKRHPDQVPPLKFKVVGVAQNLDIAREPWKAVKLWVDPQPETVEEAELAIADLQSATARVSDTNGKEAIVARNLAHYEIRAAKNARGKPAARLILDELREQGTWDAWNAVSQTLKAFWSGQLWGISNAGDASAVVLRAQRDAALALQQSWTDMVEAGILEAEEWANGNDITLGLFEWSAPDGCPMDDLDGILQANPSIGYGAMTVQSALADMPPSMEEAGYRTEVLCQWVMSRVAPFLSPEKWGDASDPDSSVPDDARQVLGVSTAGNRSMTTIGVVGERTDGRKHFELLMQREGMLWVLDYLIAVRTKTGINEVAVQASGCPAADFIKPLTDAGFIVHEIRQTALLNATGRVHDRLRDDLIRHRDDPTLNLTVGNATTRLISKMPVWDLFESPVDVAPIACLTDALYALEEFAPPPPEEIPPPPPQAETVERSDIAEPEENLAQVQF
ncbi:terminase [Pseudoclavibacter sp. RFBB5]|uniref:terminase n=1 Tax=Pseudoclavibacter sp. RFBB5 TaxID=2080574 RepID=UPI000CE80412|nr:terminase [Pseudoclavibacter sp. RFBB5]PPG29653.1 terminase [Pseudoclavibacter sp. RFBB5]